MLYLKHWSSDYRVVLNLKCAKQQSGFGGNKEDLVVCLQKNLLAGQRQVFKGDFVRNQGVGFVKESLF